MSKKRLFMLGAGFMQGVAIRAARALGCIVIAADGNPSAACAAEADKFVCIDLKDTERLVNYARYLQQNGGLDAVFTAATDFSAAVAAIAAACGLRGHRLEAALNATDKVRMRECLRKAGVPSPSFIELTAADIEACIGTASGSAIAACTSTAADSGSERALPSYSVSDMCCAASLSQTACSTVTEQAGMTAEDGKNASAVLEKRLGRLAGCFPLVVKPVDNMGARGCSLVSDLGGLRSAVEGAVRYSRTGRVIVEQYIEGSEFSIEGLVFGGQLYVTALADRHIFFPPYFIEMGHTIPSDCSSATAGEVIAVFERGVHALGLTDGAAKGDILVRNGHAFVGEIAARLSGGYMSGWTVPYSSGIDITSAAITLALGGLPQLSMSGKKHFMVPLKQSCPLVSAERAWISIPGTVAAVSGLDAARAIPFVKDVFPRAGIGDAVRFPQNNVEKCGNVLSAAPSRSEALSASETACRCIVLRLKPHVAETEEFLSEVHSFAEQNTFPPHFLQFTEPLDADRYPAQHGIVSGSGQSSDHADMSYESCVNRPCSSSDISFNISFDRILANECYEEKSGFVLPCFLAAALDTARDLQGRTLKELLQQALEQEPGLDSILCTADSEGIPKKNKYWKALIRGGLQGLLYRYDCDKV